MRQPICVVCTPRSGSTYLWSILESHPRVALTNEGRVADFLYFCSRYAQVPTFERFRLRHGEEIDLYGMVHKRHVEVFADVMRDHAVRALEDFYARAFADKEFTHWGEKMPEGETVLGLQAIYPHLKNIVLVRDARDFVSSLKTYRDRDDIRAYAPFLQEQTLPHWARLWANSYDGYLRYLEHTVVLRYEDLVLEPAKALRPVFEFLGLDGLEETLDAVARRDTFSIHATSKTAGASMGRWADDLTADEIAAVEETCGPLLERFGYELSLR